MGRRRVQKRAHRPSALIPDAGAFGLPMCSGELSKKSTGGVWQRRRFECVGRYLNYWAAGQQKRGKPAGSINLDEVTAVRLSGRDVVLHLAADAPYELRASSPAAAQRWQETLELRRAHFKSSGASVGAKGSLESVAEGEVEPEEKEAEAEAEPEAPEPEEPEAQPEVEAQPEAEAQPEVEDEPDEDDDMCDAEPGDDDDEAEEDPRHVDELELAHLRAALAEAEQRAADAERRGTAREAALAAQLQERSDELARLRKFAVHLQQQQSPTSSPTTSPTKAQSQAKRSPPRGGPRRPEDADPRGLYEAALAAKTRAVAARAAAEERLAREAAARERLGRQVLAARAELRRQQRQESVRGVVRAASGADLAAQDVADLLGALRADVDAALLATEERAAAVRAGRPAAAGTACLCGSELAARHTTLSEVALATDSLLAQVERLRRLQGGVGGLLR